MPSFDSDPPPDPVSLPVDLPPADASLQAPADASLQEKVGSLLTEAQALTEEITRHLSQIEAERAKERNRFEEGS